MEQISIKYFTTSIEAELAKNFLQSNGIKSFIKIQGVHSSGIPDGSLGADLIVWEKDAEKAKELLEYDTRQ